MSFKTVMGAVFYAALCGGILYLLFHHPEEGTRQVQGILIIVAAIILYFLPFVVSINNNHNQKMAIFLLNLFLGWTFVGWVGALVWAAIRSHPAARESAYGRAIEKQQAGRE